MATNENNNKEFVLDQNTSLVPAANVHGLLAVKKDGSGGAVGLEEIANEAGKKIGDAVKVTGTELPKLGEANKIATIYGGEDGKTMSYNGNPLPAIAKNKVALFFWDGVLETWEKIDEVQVKGDRGLNGESLVSVFDAAKIGGYAKDSLVRDEDGVTYVSLKDGNTSVLTVVADWKNIGSKVSDGFESDSATSAGSAKNSKILADSLKRLNFYATDGEDVVVGYDTIDTVGAVTSNSITSTSYSVTGGSGDTTPHSSKILVFNQSVNRIEFNSNVGGQWWICVGKRLDGAYISFNLENGLTNILSVAFRNDGTYLALNSATASQPIDRTKKLTIRYTASAIELYQETTLLFSIGKSTYNFSAPAFGLYAEFSGIVSATYAAYSPETNSIPVQEVIIQTSSTRGFRNVEYSDGTLKVSYCSATGKKVTLYGDSITVAYESSFYASDLQKKLSVSSVERKGQSGASWAGDLQSDSNINILLGTSPDIVVLHSVNDHRENSPIGLMSDVAGTSTMIGGLKKICNALINQNKNVKIILCTPLTYGRIQTWVGSDEVNELGKYNFDYTRALKEFAQCYSIPVADLTSLCEFRPQVEGSDSRMYTIDGVHPNQAGYNRMTDIIIKTF